MASDRSTSGSDQFDPFEPAFDLRTSVRDFETIARLLNVVADAHRLHYDGDGVHCRMADPANVSAVELQLHADALDAYDPTDTGDVGMECHRILDSLATDGERPPRGKVEYRPGEDRTEIGVRVEHPSQLNYEWTVRLPTIGTGTVRDDPDLDGTGKRHWRAEVSADEFVAAVRACESLSVNSYVTQASDGVRLYGNGGSGAEFDVVLPAEPETAGEGHSEYGVETIVSYDYLSDIADAIDAAPDVSQLVIEWGDEVPLRFDLEVIRGGDPMVEVTYWIAPRIAGGDNDDE